MTNLKKLQRLITEKKLSCLIINHPIDLYYLTKMDLSLGKMVVEKNRATLFVDGRYLEACKRSLDSEIDLQPWDEFNAFLQNFKGKKIGFDALQTSFSSYLELIQGHKEKSFIGIENPLAHIRAIKGDIEIAAIKKAAALNDKAFRFVRTILKEGITEMEVARKVTLFFLENGGEKVAFSPIIAFGKNSAEPHYRPSATRKLKKKEAVLVDMGVVVDHYNSDLTRTFLLDSSNREMKKIYGIVYKAVQAALKKCRPGTKIQELEDAARNIIIEAGYGKFFPHSLGHGVGLEVHEFPRLKGGKPFGNITLEKSMVITIEPGIYLPEVGGVRLEELILITEKGYKNLSSVKIEFP
jgi:Xaa-Pro aminopeptidase